MRFTECPSYRLFAAAPILRCVDYEPLMALRRLDSVDFRSTVGRTLLVQCLDIVGSATGRASGLKRAGCWGLFVVTI